MLVTAFQGTLLANDLLIVASDSTQQASASWFDYLTSMEIPFEVITPEQFSEKKLAAYVLITGGMDESGAIRDLFAQALTEEERIWLSQKGNGKMYLESDVWGQGQNVILIVGSSQSVAEAVRKGTQSDWLEKLSEWFDIETEQGIRGY